MGADGRSYYEQVRLIDQFLLQQARLAAENAPRAERAKRIRNINSRRPEKEQTDGQ